jgi:hypothetical protein
MKDELYKALSKGYADGVDQLDALDLIKELQAEVARLEALVDGLYRDLAGESI